MLGMASVWPPEISVVYGLQIQFFWIKFQSTSQTACEALNIILKLLSVFSKQLA